VHYKGDINRTRTKRKKNNGNNLDVGAVLAYYGTIIRE
jgi:hypothetical protein